MTPLRGTTCLILWALLAACHIASNAVAQFEADVRWAPPGTNVIVLVNSSRIFDSALAKKEKAQDNARAAFQTGASVPKEQVEAVAQTLEKLKGATLGLTIRESINGAVKIDFESDPSTLSKVGKSLLIEVLKNEGVMIDDFETSRTSGQATRHPLTISTLADQG